jgi:hypothetical protein
MTTREQHRVVSARPRPSSWPLVEWPWLPTRARQCTPQPWAINEDAAANAAELFDRLGGCQQLDSFVASMTSLRMARTPPIQNP